MHFPFFVLPFDHRNGLATGILNTTYPFSEVDMKVVKDLKKMVFEAIVQVKNDYSGKGALGALFDEETALELIMEAKQIGLPITVTVEKSGTKTLELIHGEQFGERLNALRPTFAKVLVHYRAGDAESQSQRALLKQVSDFCEPNGIPLMLEILLDKNGAHTPEDLMQVFAELHEAGIKVGLWKIEGFDDAEAWKTIAPHAKAPMIILGRGQNVTAVKTWIEAAAKSGVVDGFAIGRTIFNDPLSAYVNGTLSRQDAVDAIAKNYRSFIDLWEQYA